MLKAFCSDMYIYIYSICVYISIETNLRFVIYDLIRKFFGHSVGKGVGVSGIHQYAGIGIIDHVLDYVNVSRRRNLSVGRWRCKHVNIAPCYKSSE